MAKPTTKLSWITTPNMSEPTIITAPSTARKAAGWAKREVLPHGILNFLFGWISRWIDYLDAQAFEGTVTLTDTPAVKHADRTMVLGPASAQAKLTGTLANDF